MSPSVKMFPLHILHKLVVRNFLNKISAREVLFVAKAITASHRIASTSDFESSATTGLRAVCQESEGMGGSGATGAAGIGGLATVDGLTTMGELPEGGDTVSDGRDGSELRCGFTFSGSGSGAMTGFTGSFSSPFSDVDCWSSK